MKTIHSLIFCVLIALVVGIGCSTVQPNQMDSTKAGSSVASMMFCHEKDVELEMCH